MALPTTALTLHTDASDTDHIWTTYSATTPFHSGVPADGNEVQVWDDDDGKDLTWTYTALSSASPNWRSTTPLTQLPCLDFNGTADFLALFNNAATVGKVLSDVITNSAFVVVAAIRIEGGATNASNPYDNDGILSDVGGFWGIHVKNNAGAFSLLLYNFDGSADVVTLSAAIDTNYVLVYWHTGGSIFAELYTSAGLVASGNTASGNTSTLTQPFQIGRGLTTTFYSGRIGELAIYNAYDATDKANAVTYFTDKWVPAAAGGRTTKNTRSSPLGIEVGMGWRGNG